MVYSIGNTHAAWSTASNKRRLDAVANMLPAVPSASEVSTKFVIADPHTAIAVDTISNLTWRSQAKCDEAVQNASCICRHHSRCHVSSLQLQLARHIPVQRQASTTYLMLLASNIQSN